MKDRKNISILVFSPLFNNEKDQHGPNTYHIQSVWMKED